MTEQATLVPRELVEGPPAHTEDLATLQTALSEAIDEGLAHGADPNAYDERGLTPLMQLALCERDAGPAIDALVAAGADPERVVRTDHPVRYGYTALHLACFGPEEYGDPANIARLVARGANAECRDGLGDTPLHHAAEAGLVEQARALLEAGADANALDRDGQSPLIRAAFSEDATESAATLITVLLDYDADPNIVDHNDLDALECAAATDNPHAMRLLLEYGAAVRRPDDLIEAVEESEVLDRATIRDTVERIRRYAAPAGPSGSKT